MYGEHLTPFEIKELLEHVFETNLKREMLSGERPVPICIWGKHGLGKTASVYSFAKSKGWEIAYCAPAQFEEMGDFHGLPIKSEQSNETRYLPPAWVPKSSGPGILLLDDINRADDRILRGLMQLLQNFEMFSWKVPPQWQIVCTANPEGADYSVTSMDDAMLNRMLHLTMIFNVKAWVNWAISNNVDSRGINFVLSYPEIITGKKTTPRSLVQVFSQLTEISDLKKDLKTVAIIAKSGLDETTVSSLLSFITTDLEFLVGAEEILEANSFDDIKNRIEKAAKGQGGEIRLDRLHVICTRLFMALTSERFKKLSMKNKKNLINFLKLPELPSDLRFSLHRDIASLDQEKSSILNDEEISSLVLKAL
jgi:hypothetical protein